MIKPIILILDDQKQYLQALERSLRNNFEVIPASSKEEAIERLSTDIAVVLTDIRLDETKEYDRQGIDFIREARTRFRSLPVVAMSALDVPNIERMALDAGANRFLRKPIVVSDLKSLLTELLESNK